ncbi:MAG: hypothetical protein ABIY52_17580 [Gemmatimonadaceae bacterium]
MTRRIPILALCIVTACGAGDGDAADSAAPAPVSNTSQPFQQQLAEVNAYVLTMDNVNKFFSAQQNLLNKMAALSPTEREAELARSDAATVPDATLDDLTSRVEKDPVYLAAVREAGITPREYVLVTMSMMQSQLAAGVVKSRPLDDADSLTREMKANAANVRFVREHEVELTRRRTELATLVKRLAGTDGT